MSDIVHFTLSKNQKCPVEYVNRKGPETITNPTTFLIFWQGSRDGAANSWWCQPAMMQQTLESQVSDVCSQTFNHNNKVWGEWLDKLTALWHWHKLTNMKHGAKFDERTTLEKTGTKSKLLSNCSSERKSAWIPNKPKTHQNTLKITGFPHAGGLMSASYNTTV